MESIQELREKLQKEKVQTQGWQRPWGYKTFQRGPSIYITRLLLRFPITPNQVTVACIIFGIIGSLFMFEQDWRLKLVGLVFIYLNILSDKVDGELARYKQTYSLRGIFLDEINHLVIPPLFWLGLTFGILPLAFIDNTILLPAGIVGAFALIIIRVVHSLPAQIYAKKYIKHPDFFPTTSPENAHSPISHKSMARMFLGPLRVLHQFQDFFIMSTAVTIAILLERLLLLDYPFHPLLIYIVLGGSGLLSLFALEVIIKKLRSVEREVHALASVATQDDISAQ